MNNKNYFKKIMDGPHFDVNSVYFDIISDKNELKKLSVDQIDIIIKRMYIGGFTRCSKIGKSPNIKFEFGNSCQILNEITKYHIISEKSLNIIFNVISTTNEIKIKKYNYFVWVANLKKLGCVLSNKYINILKKWGYIDISLEFLNNKKITFSQLSKFFNNYDCLIDFFKNKETLIKTIIASKIKIDHKLFYLIFEKTSELYHFFTKNFEDNKEEGNIDNFSIINILSLFKMLNYKLSLDDCLICFSHNSCNITIPKVKKSKNILPTSHQITQTLEQLLKLFENEYDISLILNYSLLSTNSNFLTYLVETNRASLIDKNIGITCAIIFKNLQLLEYYVQKKFIATEEHILLFLHSLSKCDDSIVYNDYNNSIIFLKQLISSGATITEKLVEIFLLAGFYCDDEFYNFAELCNTINSDEIKKIKFKHAKLLYSRYNDKKKLKSGKNDISNILKTNCVHDLIKYENLKNLKTLSDNYAFVLSNNYLSTFEFLRQRDKYVPTIYEIMSENCLFTRHILLCRFYPELLQNKHFKKEQNNNINILNKKMNNKEDDQIVILEEKPKKSNKKMIVQPIKKLEQFDSNELVDF